MTDSFERELYAAMLSEESLDALFERVAGIVVSDVVQRFVLEILEDGLAWHLGTELRTTCEEC